MIKEVSVSQIEALTTRIERQLGGLTAGEKNISQLEKDLLLENLRVLYQCIYDIEIVDNDVSKNVSAANVVEEESHPVKEEKIVENTSLEIENLKDSLIALKRQFEHLSNGEELQSGTKEEALSSKEKEVLLSPKQEEAVIEKEKNIFGFR
ncbi:MAG: hypothetical protein U9R32_05095 [Bacteroidota bacterium]|nr:hypothetical protein [Bacteroidota bacterium]